MAQAPQGLTFRPTDAAEFGRIAWIDAGAHEGADCLNGCEVYTVESDGAPVAHVALRRLDPNTVEVTAVQGIDARRRVTGRVWQAIESCIQAEHLRCVTARAGVARLLIREGWKTAGYIMQKDHHGRP